MPVVEPVTRYVITHMDQIRDCRTLTFAAQGRNTYATEAEAQKALAAFRENGLDRVLTAEQMATLEVRACPCWPVHFDPVGVWFDVSGDLGSTA